MDVLTQKLVKTRKPHTCFGCGRTFPASTRMEFSTIADGGTVDNSYSNIMQGMGWLPAKEHSNR